MAIAQIKQGKAVGTKKRLFQKRQTALKYKTKKVISSNPNKSIIRSVRAQLIQAKSSPSERAQLVQANLTSQFPSFVKPMLPSHVTGGFWLSFPKRFSDLHMPKHDDIVVLVDESEKKYETKYLASKNGLSGGWRGFSIAHKLLDEDVLVFQLIEPCKFKVYIVRANDFTDIDGAIGLLTLDACAKPMDTDQSQKDIKISGTTGEKCPDNSREKGMVVLNTDQSGNDSEDFGSEVWEGIRFSQSVVDFKDVKGFEDFNILVDGLIIDSEVPTHLRTKYYELCCTQNSYIHDHLLGGLNCKLAAGIISETVNIADAIRACKLTPACRDNVKIWDSTLKAFEELGMKVGFLRARLNKLTSLSFESQEVMEAKSVEKMLAEEEMRGIEMKMFNVKEMIKNLDAEIEGLNVKGIEVMFQEVANAPW